MVNVMAIGLTPSRTGIVIGPSRTGIVIGPSRTGFVIGPSRTGFVIGRLLNAQLRHECAPGSECARCVEA